MLCEPCNHDGYNKLAVWYWLVKNESRWLPRMFDVTHFFTTPRGAQFCRTVVAHSYKLARAVCHLLSKLFLETHPDPDMQNDGPCALPLEVSATWSNEAARWAVKTFEVLDTSV